MNTHFRSSISAAVKELRLRRCFSQAEFARFLNITQAGLSHIESGKSSLSAEQLIFLIEKFNLSFDDFVKRKKVLPEQELQNAMAKFGAAHLVEIPNIVVSETLLDVNEVIYEVLARAYHSRLIAHLAPVVVKNATAIEFLKISDRLIPIQKQNRIWWFVEKTYDAVRERLLDNNFNKVWQKYYQDAERLLLRNKGAGEALKAFKYAPSLFDILDDELISQGYVTKAKERSDDCAKKWGIITSLKTKDFYEALKETDEHDNE